MTAHSTKKLRFVTLTLIIGLVVAIFGLLSLHAGAQPDPANEPFEGRLLPAPPGTVMQTGEPIDRNNLGPGWRARLTENFEDQSWEDRWINVDRSNGQLGYMWGTRAIPNALDPTSVRVAWAVGGGDSGSSLDPIAPNYPAGVSSWLVAGPFDLSTAKDALMNFDLYYASDGNDPFTLSYSYNRLDFTEYYTMDQNVPNGSWQQKTIQLGQFAGDKQHPQIYFAFTFSSSNGSNDKVGVMLDNVELMTEGDPGSFIPMLVWGPTATPLPVTPTATRPPRGPARWNFDDDIIPWKRVVWDGNSEVRHENGSDSGREGFLNIESFGDNSYVIVSPLHAGPEPPYNIETVVKLRSPRETGNQYGVIFGANYDGGVCPSEPQFNTCFTEYYEMRVRYYIVDGKHRMDMKLKRVNSDGSDKDLIEWTRARDIDEDDFVEWDVTVSSSGKISISADDQFIDSVTDTRYIDNPYFGVIVRNEDKDTEAKFDYLKITD